MHSTQIIFSSQTVAELLACSARTVDERAQAGDLPGLKFGKACGSSHAARWLSGWTRWRPSGPRNDSSGVARFQMA